MKVLAAGGGSGGHVTPVLAVINELHRLETQLDVVFVCDAAFESQARGLMAHALVPVRVQRIAAGKLRRYHNQTWRETVADWRTIVFNIRDVGRIGIGFMQSLWLLARFRPDVVFAKGGYVCLPLGLAAKMCRIPLVIHDSDTRPGLTNSILGRFADVIATGSPLENYRYPKGRSHYIGVPIDAAFHPFSAKEQRQAKSDLGLVDIDAPLVVVTGGGLGAKSINMAISRDAPTILAAGIHIYHVSGKAHHEAMQQLVPAHPHYHLVPFVYTGMDQVLGAADVIVSRGSATFLQEMAALAKPVIVVPSKYLGDQIKNTQVFDNAGAIVALSDDDIAVAGRLGDVICQLATSEKRQRDLSQKLHRFAKPHAARDLAQLILSAYRKAAG